MHFIFSSDNTRPSTPYKSDIKISACRCKIRMNIDFLQSSIYFGWNNCRNYFHWRNKISVCISSITKRRAQNQKVVSDGNGAIFVIIFSIFGVLLFIVFIVCELLLVIFFLNCHFDRRIRNLWWCAETTIEPNPFRCKYETVLTVAPIEIPLSHLQIRTHNGFSSSIYPLSGELFSMQRRYRSSGGYFKWIKTQKSGTTMTLLLIIVWRR